MLAGGALSIAMNVVKDNVHVSVKILEKQCTTLSLSDTIAILRIFQHFVISENAQPSRSASLHAHIRDVLDDVS